MADLLTLGINWVRASDRLPTADEFDRILAIVPCFVRDQWVFEATVFHRGSDHWFNNDGYETDEIVAWCSMNMINISARSVFGPAHIHKDSNRDA